MPERNEPVDTQVFDVLDRLADAQDAAKAQRAVLEDVRHQQADIQTKLSRVLLHPRAQRQRERFATLVILIVMGILVTTVWIVRSNDVSNLREIAREGCETRNHNAQAQREYFRRIADEATDEALAQNLNILAATLRTQDCAVYVGERASD